MSKKTFNLYGTIVDTDSERETYEDVTPSQIASFIKGLEDGEELEININSPGGSVSGGINIYNQLIAAKKNHKITCVGSGLIGSIATIIMCAGDIVLADSAMVMIHLPWTVIQGNSQDIAKEAKVLDMMANTMVNIYRTKFDLTEDQILEMMRNETWFSGAEAKSYGLDCTVYQDAAAIKRAAKVINSQKANYKHKPGILMENEIQETTEDIKEEIRTDNNLEEPKTDEIKESEIEVEESIPKAEVDKRISGLQSTYAKQINAIKADYEARINDLMVKQSVTEKELMAAKAAVTNLTGELEDSKKGIEKISSALSEKEKALAMLNANVLSPNDTLPTLKQGVKACRTPKEVVDFITSGKYRN